MNCTIYILLPVHNRKEVTLEFVHCLLEQSYKNFRLIMIDDGSTDGTTEAVVELMPAATVLRGDGHLWWAGCMNLALDWLLNQHVSDDSIVLMINDDTVFKSDFLEQACKCLDKPGTLWLARLEDPVTGEVKESGMHLDVRKMNFYVSDASREINTLPTRGLFMFYSDLIKIGKFRDKWLPHYGSDNEFTYRAYRKGLSLKTSEKLFLIHDKRNTNYKSNLPEKLSLSALFSKKHNMNPVMLSRLAILVSPASALLPNLLRIWCRAFKKLV